MNRLLIEACVALVLAVAGFFYGCSITADELNAKHDADLSRINAASHLATSLHVEAIRQLEEQHATEMAALDAKHFEELQNEKRAAETVIADVRAGAYRVRDEFKCGSAATGREASPAGTGTSLGNAAKAGGLQTKDIELVLREAARADEVTVQLQACQGIVRNDRAVKP
jgi:hypothetical protein